MLDGVSTNTQGNSFPPHGRPFVTNRALLIGNGQSRRWYCPSHQLITTPVTTWGCNAIYRDGDVDHLVAVDYSMQQEIYDSDYDGKCHFAHWSPVPSTVAEMMFMGYDIPDAFIHRSKTRGEECVIQGKDPNTLQEKIEIAIQMNPQLDIPDLVKKMEKDVGVWITYLKEEDNVVPIDYPVGWSTGNTAMHLACQEGVEEVFILGYDLSSYDEDLNNLYKGTDNYLSADARGFNSTNWMNQMATVFGEFSDIQFYWVDRQFDEKLYFNNVRDLTKDELCDILHIL